MTSDVRFRRYPVYKDSGVEWLGDIPDGWSVKRVKRVFKVINGATPASGEPALWDGDIPWVTPEDLGALDGAVIGSTSRSITKAGYQSCGTTLVPAGSLVLSTRAPIGHLARAGVDLCTNQGCRSLVVRGSDSREYFFYEMLAARPELESLGQGSTFRELAKGMLEDVELAAPSEPEQHAVAAFLDRETARIDALVEQNERLIDLLRQERAARVAHAVTKGLDRAFPMKDSGVEWLGQIPAHWTVKPLKRALQSGSADGSLIKGKMHGEPGDGLFPGFSASGQDIWVEDAQHDKSGIVLSAVGARCGKTFRADGKWTAVANTHVFFPRRGNDRDFLWYLTNDEAFWERGGTAQPFVRVSSTLQRPWCFPPLLEQRSIAAFLDRRTARTDALIAKTRNAIERVKELRAALISTAVTGKIDVREEAA